MKITILSADMEPMSSIGKLLYRDEDGNPGSIYMNHRCFMNFLEGVGNPIGKIFVYDGEGLLPIEP